MSKAQVGKQLAFASFETADAFLKRNAIHVYKKLSIDEGLQLINKMSNSKTKAYESITLSSKSNRHKLYANGYLFCSCCGLEGTEFRIQRDIRSDSKCYSLGLFGYDNKNVLQELTWDHIIPVSVFGSNRLVNAQIMCKKCNVEKGNKLSPAEYQELLTHPNFNIMVTDTSLARKRINSLIKNLKNYKGLKVTKFHNPVKEIVYQYATTWVETLLAGNKPKLLNLKHQVWRFRKVTLG